MRALPLPPEEDERDRVALSKGEAGESANLLLLLISIEERVDAGADRGKNDSSDAGILTSERTRCDVVGCVGEGGGSHEDEMSTGIGTGEWEAYSMLVPLRNELAGSRPSMLLRPPKDDDDLPQRLGPPPSSDPSSLLEKSSSDPRIVLARV